MNVHKILKMSVMTSLLSKSSGVLFQILAIPLALSALGTEGFALFMVLSGLTAWVGLCTTGVSPSLTSRVASGLDDKTTLKYFFNAFLFISFVVFGLGFPLFAAITAIFDITIIEERYNEFLFLYLFVASLVVTTIVDSVNSGRNKPYVTNLYFSLGNLINLILMLIATLIIKTDDPLFLFYMSQTGLIIVRLINSLTLLKELGVTRSSFCIERKIIHELSSNIGSFFFIQLSVAFSQQAIVLFAFNQSKELSASLSVIFRLYALFSSALNMISQPLWPMIIKVRSSGNVEKLMTWHHRLVVYNIVCAVFFSILIYTQRQEVNQIWLNGQLNFTDLEYAFFLGNYVLIALGQVNFTFLMGYEKFNSIARMLFLEMCFLAILISLISINSELSVSSVMISSSLCFILSSLWIGFLLVNRQFKAIK